jgi:hypothetical protein
VVEPAKYRNAANLIGAVAPLVVRGWDDISMVVIEFIDYDFRMGDFLNRQNADFDF